MNKTSHSEAFFAAPFAVDGELVGIGRWEVAALSLEWLLVCEEMIRNNGACFRASFGQMLSHIEVKLTSASGPGLGMFYAHSRLILSTAYLSGYDPAAEQKVVGMFIESLRRVDLVHHAKATNQPFAAMATIAERPLHVVIPWPVEDVSEPDQELVRELANHFAAAYLCRRDRSI